MADTNTRGLVTKAGFAAAGAVLMGMLTHGLAAEEVQLTQDLTPRAGALDRHQPATR